MNENTTMMAERPQAPGEPNPEKVKINTSRSDRKKDIPKGLWTKCESCSEIIYNKALEENMRVCPKCDHHLLVGANQRIDMLVDSGSFKEMDFHLRANDPLKFCGPKSYLQKLESERKKTGLSDAVITGTATLGSQKIVIAVTDARFIMGSMGSVVGERLTRAIEHATAKKLPVVIISGSGGGARMYEGVLSLMQMAKTSAALCRHDRAGLLFVSILTNPTMAGIMASFASLGDLIIAEPKALIGFTGPRVIEQTIRQRLPEGFQTSEFLLEHGWLDKVVHRKKLRETLTHFIQLFDSKRNSTAATGKKRK